MHVASVEGKENTYAVHFLSNPFFIMLALYIGKNTVFSIQNISFNVHNDSIETLHKKTRTTTSE